MEVTFISGRDAERVLIDLTRSCTKFSWAVAWATPNALTREALKHRKKMKQLVIGTHFYQTDPKLLMDFTDVKSARVKPPTGALFHPKVYLFTNGASMSALVGSHNMTKSALGGRNTEASVLMQGPVSHPALAELTEFVSAAWQEAKPIDGVFLRSYLAQYEVNREAREALEEFHELKEPLVESAQGSPLDLTWESFKDGIKADPHNSVERRLKILEAAQQLFERHGSFALMDKMERKAIAGTFADNEPGLADLPWGWFGSMFGAGTFKALVNEPSELLSRALDRIPLRGPVAESQYKAFVSDFKAAFDGSARKGNIAPASRLLALKRPDQFVAVNDRNRRGLCSAFGTAFSTLNLDNYWARIIVPMTLSPWWREQRPSSPRSARLWDNRAAMLDCIYYEQ